MRTIIILATLLLLSACQSETPATAEPFTCDAVKESTWVGPTGETFSLSHISSVGVAFSVPVMDADEVVCVAKVTMTRAYCGGDWEALEETESEAFTCEFLENSTHYRVLDDKIEICTSTFNCISFNPQ